MRGLAALSLLGACARPPEPSVPAASAPAPVAAAPAPAPEVATPPAEPAAPPPKRTPPPQDPTGVRPPPVDDDLAALPPDMRVPDEATLLRTHERECAFGPRPRCEHAVDLDGDGAPERVAMVRARATRHLGLAVIWATGGVSIIGADARVRILLTDVYVDGVELAWEEVENDFEIERWRVAEQQGDGFVVGPRPRRGATPQPPMRAPARAGGGVLVSNSDSSTILYWDGAGWRRLVLF